MDDKGSIINNCTVLHSTWDDAKDIDRARYRDEGRKSRQNKHISVPVRDHAGQATAETRRQLELTPVAQVA